MVRFRIVAQVSRKTPRTSRGFVLSFSIFALALILIITTQLHHSHLLAMQTDSVQVQQTTAPARVLRDIALDFNTLTGQTISIDQTQTQSSLRIHGKIPNPLNLQQNLLRYQTNLFRLGRDSNTSIFLDLNQTISDGNLWGRTNTGMRWRERLDSNSFKIYTVDYNDSPIYMDVNIFSDIPYDRITPVVTTLGGPVLALLSNVSITYKDANASHDLLFQVTSMGADSYSWQLEYDINDIVQTRTFRLETYGDPTPLAFSIEGSPSIPWSFDINYTVPNDINGSYAGYDINATLRGNDFTADMNTIWTYGR